VWWQRHDDGSISPSTAYEGYQTPCICLTWMFELIIGGSRASTTALCYDL
jgi:hypothetical protein